MPLDRIQARKLCDGAQSHYSRGLHSEFINKLADQLRDALEALDQFAIETTRAKNDSIRYQRELDEEKTHYRKLREASAHVPSMIELLKAISNSPKGAQKKAEELLKTMGIVDAPAPVTPTEVPKVVVP